MEISKQITKKTIIYICIIIIIIIILRILYSNVYSNIEGFDTSTSAANDLLSKLKSTYAQEIVNPTNIDLEMQIYSWSNKLHNMLYTLEQTKPIAFYKPILNINSIEYSKLGDIVSQNTDYSLPNVDQFTLLVKKHTSDIKSPTRFDLIAEIEFPNFDNNYYNFSNYIGNTVNINVIKNSIVNCASTLNNLNTIIQNNLSIVQNKFTNKGAPHR